MLPVPLRRMRDERFREYIRAIAGTYSNTGIAVGNGSASHKVPEAKWKPNRSVSAVPSPSWYRMKAMVFL